MSSFFAASGYATINNLELSGLAWDTLPVGLLGRSWLGIGKDADLVYFNKVK
jgi:hypothetical protein